MSQPDVSAVVPVFNEEESLAELHRRVSGVLDGLDVSWELVLVNDGSRDRTPAILDDLCACDSRCRAIHPAATSCSPA